MENMLPQRIFTLRGGMPMSHFAKRVGIDASVLSKYERGFVVPSAEVVWKICRTFGVSADWLLGLSDNQSPNNDKSETISPKTIAESDMKITHPQTCSDCEIARTLCKIVDRLSDSDWFRQH